MKIAVLSTLHSVSCTLKISKFVNKIIFRTIFVSNKYICTVTSISDAICTIEGTMKMYAICLSETLAATFKITGSHNPIHHDGLNSTDLSSSCRFSHDNMTTSVQIPVQPVRLKTSIRFVCVLCVSFGILCTSLSQLA